MNPEMPQPPHDELESSLTALLLGELPHDQAAALHQKLAQDAELARLYERLRNTINLVRETVASPATQTANQPAPLKLSEERREKLLAHFKTVAPKEFVPPRRRPMSWLVPVGIAAALVALLAATLLPALSKAKSRSLGYSHGTWSLSESVAPAPAVASQEASSLDEMRNALVRPKRSAVAKSLPQRPAEAKPPAEIPANAKSPATFIVLPKPTELADAASTPAIAEGGRPWSTTSTLNGFYDDSSIRAGGRAGSLSFGGLAGAVPGAASASEGRKETEDSYKLGRAAPQGVASDLQDLFQRSNARQQNNDQNAATWQSSQQHQKQGNIGLPPIMQGAVASTAPAAILPPAPTAPLEDQLGKPAKGYGFSLLGPKDSLATDVKHEGDLRLGIEVARADDANKSGDTATAPSDAGEPSIATAGAAFHLQAPAVNTKAKVAEIGQSDQKAVGFDWYLGNGLMNKGAIKGQGGTAPAGQAGKSSGTADLGVAAAGTVTLNYQGDFDQTHQFAKGQAGLANSEGEKAPLLGDLPAVGRLFRGRPEAARERVSEKAGQPTPGPSTYSLNAVGYVDVKSPIAATNFVTVVPTETSSADKYTYYRKLSQPGGDSDAVSRASRSPIVLPTAQGETKLALNESSGADKKVRQLANANRELGELQRSRQILDAKIATEGIDAELPKTRRVDIIDRAAPASSPTSTLWERIRGKAGDYESTARIKVERDQSGIAGVADVRQPPAYDPYFVQTEFEAIQSEPVLGKVIKELNLNETWGNKKGGKPLTTAETMALLKSKLDLRPEKNSNLIDVGVKSDQPEEAARIANAVAEAYAAQRLEQRKQLSMDGAKALEKRFVQQEQKARDAQKKVDDLRAKLQTSEPAAQIQAPDVAPRKPAAAAPVPQPEVQTAENAFSTFSLNVSDVSFKLAAASLEKGRYARARQRSAARSSSTPLTTAIRSRRRACRSPLPGSGRSIRSRTIATCCASRSRPRRWAGSRAAR